MRNRIIIMTSIVLGMLVASIDTTITHTTMPVIAADLGGMKWYAWTFASYMIFMTVLSPIAGRISDLFGRKKVFAFGLLVFLIGSVLCGSSQTMLQLVLFRAIQGMGAGIMMPFPAIIAGDLFSIEKRGKIQALFSGMWALSAIVAPLLGSIFVEYLSWRWVFYVNIPICLLSLAMLVPYREVYEARRSPIDYMGAILFCAAIIVLLLLTVVESYYIVYAIAGVILLISFYMYERKQEHPIVPLSLFRIRAVAWMNVSNFFAYAAMFGASSFLPMLLQNAGYSVFLSGVALLGMSGGWMAVSVPSGKLILRYGYRRLMLIGNILLVCAGIWFVQLPVNYGFWFVFFGCILLGLAFGLLSTVSVIGSQQLVGAHEKGVSTSLQMFCRNIGTVAGVTAMGMFLGEAASFAGFKNLFMYGFIVSLFGLACSFFIIDRHNEAGTGQAGA